jgi:hypothetical protein
VLNRRKGSRGGGTARLSLVLVFKTTVAGSASGPAAIFANASWAFLSAIEGDLVAPTMDGSTREGAI